jgi:hypothetical protein
MKATLVLLALLGTAVAGSMQTAPADRHAWIAVQAVSTDAARVTGGNLLVRIVLSPTIQPDTVRVMVGDRTVTDSLWPGSAPHTLMGIVRGLEVGRNTITVTSADGRARGSLEVTNYPITGPVISGPWQQPFICQTDAFKLPDGTALGPPLDENCSARTVVKYVYLPSGPIDERQPFKPLPEPASPVTLPGDVARTTTTAGVTVNFIVRVETGTINRGIYQNAVLFDPTVDQPPTPAAPPRGWNRRLLAVHGTGCPGGWYLQGAALGVPVLDPVRLGEGYAIYNNTLNHPTNNCNAFLAGETAMMGKEHFIETFGVPVYTISWGRSGGAYTSLQLADAFPGLFDGVDISLTFPDAYSIASSALDARLLMHYFNVTNPGGLTEPQKIAIGGYHGMQAMIDMANQSQRTDPVPDRGDLEGYRAASWNAAVPAHLRYDPVKNPAGARPTVFDAARNIYGVDPTTGAALRPWDNAGVQYGLNALNAGVITPAQFLDLNEKIGGIDRDANYIKTRTVANPDAVRRTYQSGLTLGANGGLPSIPIFDNATSNEEARYHYGWFHFALRERLRQASGGSSENMVMWRSVSGSRGRDLFDRWVTDYKADTSTDHQRVKVLRAKPKDAVDGCFDKSAPPRFIPDALPFTNKPLSPCSELYPVYSHARREAGAPLAANVIKCQLKPVDQKDYKVKLSSAEMTRLMRIFPGGVCDWSKPGVGQTPVVTWASFGPSPKNQIFSLAAPRESSR